MNQNHAPVVIGSCGGTTRGETIWNYGSPTVNRFVQQNRGAVSNGGPSRVPPLPRETRLKVITTTVQQTPPNATHWSRALMAEAVGISPSSVGR